MHFNVCDKTGKTLKEGIFHLNCDTDCHPRKKNSPDSCNKNNH